MSTIQKINFKSGILILLILVAVFFRFLPILHSESIANFTPVGAIALFGGTYFKNKYTSYLLPLVTLFMSDILLNYFYSGKLQFFYEGIFWVYLSFAIMVFIGSKIKSVNIQSLLFASVLSVLVHWLLTDIQPWLGSNMYNKDFSGYIQSLIAAIPFERNMLLSNLLFVTILYGSNELVTIFYSKYLEKIKA